MDAPQGDMTDGDWAALMISAQRGEAEHYRRLLRLLRIRLTNHFRHRLPPVMVEDAVRSTLKAIHLKRHTFDPRQPFGPWLAAITRYKWIDRLRTIERVSFDVVDTDPLTAAGP